MLTYRYVGRDVRLDSYVPVIDAGPVQHIAPHVAEEAGGDAVKHEVLKSRQLLFLKLRAWLLSRPSHKRMGRF